MEMNDEADWMFMAMLQGSALRATPRKHCVSQKLATSDNSVILTALFVLTTVVIDALAARESIDENPHGIGSVAVCEETTDEDGARNLQTTSSSTAGEMETGPAPQGKRGGGGELLPLQCPTHVL
ncbi:uncharacterized protein LOC142767037 isoform X1 [Rhipicephalus microplus]|uniref:uncharacterized protein LOC142767037 isoform X1 n=1 Tax=Rhipicephalus microplus TaxID=6941 RepID=UPI003F6CB03A